MKQNYRVINKSFALSETQTQAMPCLKTDSLPLDLAQLQILLSVEMTRDRRGRFSIVPPQKEARTCCFSI